MHRQVILDYAQRISLYRDDRDQMESSFISGAEGLADGSDTEKLAYSKACFEKANTATIKWLEDGKNLHPFGKGYHPFIVQCGGNLTAWLCCLINK